MLGLDELVDGLTSPSHARGDSQPLVDGSLMTWAADAGPVDLPVAAGELVAAVKDGDQGTVDDQSSTAGGAVDQCES